MPSQVTNYKCPSCTGPLHFSSETGKLSCDYCGSSFDVAEIEALYAEKEKTAAEAKDKADAKADKQATEQKESGDTGWNTEHAGEDWGSDAEKMKSYSCPSCGAELICDETTAATSCPYCGNPTIVPGQFSGNSRRPNYLIPFKLNKEAAVAALKNHYKGKFLLPKSFSNENHIEELKGIYVPFWLFDAKADADITFNGTRTRSYRSGDYEVTETKHYDIHRSGSIDFERIPVDGSSKMPDDYMDSIEPFDYKDLKPFSTAYMPGFLADKYDVDAKKSSKRADRRCQNSAVECMRDTITSPYNSITIRNKSVNLHRGNVNYAMLPVWLLSTKWKDKNYLFAMNGQTGKLVGDLPIDKKKLRLFSLGLAVGLSIITSLLFSGPLGSLFSSL